MSTSPLSFAKAPLKWFLKNRFFRSRTTFEIKQDYFADLDINVPISHGIECPITSSEHWYSFQEIFFGKEYDLLGSTIPLPRCWIDIGCHAGYFSLFTLWKRHLAGLKEPVQALLIDADSRSKLAVERLIEKNNLRQQFQFLSGAVASSLEPITFSERPFMSSSISNVQSEDSTLRKVDVVSAGQILQLLRPPYDLIKVDVEGAEYEFLTSYAPVLKETKMLLLEWHSWHRGGGGVSQLMDMASSYGFKFLAEPIPAHASQWEGKPATCGVIVFNR